MSEIPEPSLCRTMGDVRQAIDALDRRLVRLVADRQRYVERAAQIKTGRDAVRDEARIAEVIAKVLAEAQTVGLSVAIAEPVWRVLVERSIAHELDAFDRVNTG